MRPPARPTLEGLVDDFASAPQRFDPGTLWSYDNASFSVAGRTVEVVTGEPFPQGPQVLRGGGLGRGLERFVLQECLGVGDADPAPLADRRSPSGPSVRDLTLRQIF